jgi:extracellular factor (EF) 3-hydroxypalmitic acid methyl ester biosynthesis protein
MDSPARAALIEMLKTEFAQPVVRYTEEIDAAVRGASPTDVQPLKEYAARQLGEFLMLAPSMARARHKPLGYAGDFEVMRHMYERHFDGTSLFSRALNLAFTHTRAGHAVRARKDLLKQELQRQISLSAGKDAVRVLAIAAGPAQELFEVLQEVESIPARLEVVLLDQERQALSYAYGRLKRLVDGRWPGKVQIQFRYDTIRKLLTDRSCLEGLGEFDFVYASGLFDYLGKASAVRLTGHLYRHVRGGGNLYIGNMSPSNPTKWLMEHHADWHLIYRTPQEMVEFATAGALDADVGIVEERTGVNPFVRIRRP